MKIKEKLAKLDPDEVLLAICTFAAIVGAIVGGILGSQLDTLSIVTDILFILQSILVGALIGSLTPIGIGLLYKGIKSIFSVMYKVFK